ncbi:DNA polymerase III subunit epsilon [Aureimonas sp. SA4125]|uniref:DNA polymerase III subunit epsilon n=1 Tax=Aureimonas sp. SA4125 TaxID=2826993 RepID=UPI001CC5C2E9|nr:DNA polymerase III subunit epsilon [Aureimonas sp. SA4125]BDA86858.1 DNA polymerase III subunit epsilon [Aureimonas sp. SA4125]
MREIVFDTETTGLDFAEDRVIEIGAVELWNHIPTGREWHCFVSPGSRRVDPGAFDVHGISNDFLKDKPGFAAVVEAMLDFFGDATLIAHNASFDMRFLNAELARVGRPPLDPGRIVDTLQMARRKFPMAPATLDALCSRFSIDTTKRDKHGALVDSLLLAGVYIELIGGRQAALGLVSSHQEEQRDADGAVIRIQPRQVPLPPRVTADEAARHRAFVETLGSEALWLSILPAEATLAAAG